MYYNLILRHFLGSFLSGMFRAVIPIMKKSAVAAGQELLKSGVNVVQDVWRTGDLKEAQKQRGKEFISNISNRVSDHMFGKGYSSLMGIQRKQLKRGSGTNKTRKTAKKKPAKGKKAVKKKKAVTKKKKKKQTTTKRTKQTIQDIFT